MVYETKNLINDKVYIGAAYQRDRYFGSCIELKEDIEKYGIENFEREILLETDSVSEANAFEAMLTPKWFCDLDCTYNKKIGGGNFLIGVSNTGENNGMFGRTGKDNPMYGFKHTEATKQKMSDNHPDFSGSKNPMYGFKHTAEAKQKMSESKSGSKNPMFGKTGENNPRARSVEVNGVQYPTRKKAAEALGVSPSCIRLWILKNKHNAKYL